ncbi:tyrosine recombinase XerS [Lactococcus petauri]|uniref:tyrosine recombinase XerS n=1 Tax=Lactococcus petauri TaxID=1940789 RepID=UPI0013FDD16A|nr:tyrosine recombinase XerS [Lactococcus petauri]NHI77375.1 tyrosine recombinase XerS [Lactococcus petauri]
MNKQRTKIDELLVDMPIYVRDYTRSKLVIPYSYVTLINYLRIFKRFFAWLMDNNYTKATHIKEIELHELENLPKQAIEKYRIELRENINKKNHRRLNKNTINHIFSALKSLFHYLSAESEDIDGNSYIDRDVMSRIQLSRERETLSYRASRLEGKLFLGEDTSNFIDYIENNFQHSLSNKQKRCFEKTKKRDLAIISLFLASGIRISELVNIKVNDIDLDEAVVQITRKNNKEDSVPIAKFALPYLMEYEKKRNTLHSDDDYLFMSLYQGHYSRITEAAVYCLVTKYSEAFKVKVSPHTLRHTLATRLYSKTKSQVLVSQQLGHSTSKATDLYTHIVDKDLKKALDNL